MNISPLTAGALVEAGWEAHRVSVPLSEDSSDEDILVYAAKTDCVVCTQDLDFSDLLAVSRRDWPSVITLRLSGAAPEAVTCTFPYEDEWNGSYYERKELTVYAADDGGD